MSPSFPDETVPVLVPYGESGKRIIADILAERGKQVPYDLIRKSQSYTVALGHGQCKSLEKQEGIRPYFDGRLLVLQDGFSIRDKNGNSLIGNCFKCAFRCAESLIKTPICFGNFFTLQLGKSIFTCCIGTQ